ncbi:MAG: hypothetical protein K6E99_00065 [Bacilli bacterium]|nr:hypothetical protein [Bacilli bacterium]
MKNSKKPILLLFLFLIICVSLMFGVKKIFFADLNILEPIRKIMNPEKNASLNGYVEAVTKAVKTEEVKTNKPYSEIEGTNDEDFTIYEGNDTGEYVYSTPPTFEDDGSIIYDGMTITELTDKLNKSLKSNLTNTGYFYADFTRRTGFDPYLAVAITLEETGCSSSAGCASWAVSRNNWGGMIGCNYETLDKGLEGYFNNLYNGYWSQGLNTPELIAGKYNPSNAYNYAQKIRRWMEVIKNKE